MEAPPDRFYTPTHEWIKPDGDAALVGITRFAVDELTDVTYVELPAPGASLTAGKPFGEIESVKTAGELYAPVSGEVIEANEAVKKDPSLINQDPYGKAWLIRIKTGPNDYSGLMTAQQYQATTAKP
ncbi:MAG: glycine cleavage system protein GcvH [Planctomycetes bacterium]|nr:glycine cleavage system protein GcvH [Planctomycetota bacterium]